jgi:hypothetical protein
MQVEVSHPTDEKIANHQIEESPEHSPWRKKALVPAVSQRGFERDVP